MEYTLNDVLDYWREIKPIKKTRYRDELDPRNYIIALLHYKFRITEIELESIIGIDRSSINYSKKHPYNLTKVNEPTFMKNTEEVREKFPYKFPSVNKNDIAHAPFSRQYSYTVHFDKKIYAQIQRYSKVNDIDARVAIRNLVQKALVLWEE